METVNPKNFVDIDPLLVSFITLKDGNMIMIDETVPAKPNKVRLFQEEEKNNIEPMNKKKNKSQKLSISEQLNLNFIRSQKKMEPITIIKKSDFNSISSIYKNTSFSFVYNKDGIKNTNLPSPNCSVDIKSSMFQTRRDNNNINFNNTNMNTINNNILSEDNVNIHMIDTTISKQMNNNNNEKKDQIVPANIFKSNIVENNYKLKSKNENEDNQKINFENNKNNYDSNDNNNNNFLQKDNINDNIVKDEQNDMNLNSNKNNDNLNNFNEMKNKIINRPSLVIQNKILYSQNNYRSNNLSTNEPIKNNLTEINKNDISRDKKRNSINRYSKINNRLSKSGKDNNYVKAVVSLNIPAEDQEEINLVKQFNSLVDRLNGQKSHQHTKINLKKSDKYYELYKNSNEINLLNRILSPERNKKKFEHNNYIIDANNNYSNSKFIDNNLSNYFSSNDVSMISYGRNNNLNSRILALRERTYTSINNSFRNDSKDNFSSSINSEIVLPSNFAFRK